MAQKIYTEHFPRNEVKCKCCGKVGNNPDGLRKLLRELEALRKLVNRPVHTTNIYRCEKENARVGGVPNSYHMQGMAADCWCENMSVDELARYARMCAFGGVGKYYEKGFVHVDIGPLANWEE